MTGHKTSLEFRRRLLKKLWQRDGRTSCPSEEYVRQRMHCDPDSLKRAAEFFGLNLSIPVDVHTLALVLAEELFGKLKRGRRAGNAAWDAVRFLELAFLYEELKSDSPRASNTRLAAAIVENAAFKEYRNNPELIRQRLPKAKRLYDKWATDYAADMMAMYRDEAPHADDDL